MEESTKWWLFAWWSQLSKAELTKLRDSCRKLLEAPGGPAPTSDPESRRELEEELRWAIKELDRLIAGS